MKWAERNGSVGNNVVIERNRNDKGEETELMRLPLTKKMSQDFVGRN